MRWEYEQPRAKLFVSDGKNVWFYVPGEADARRATLKRLDDLRSPLRYLLGKTKLEKEFSDLQIRTSPPGQTTLRGFPKAMSGQVRDVELSINAESQIEYIRIHETDGSITEFRFRDIVEDAPAPANLFHFSPPPGVGVISSEELAP
jgi:outer membrane lipoprotein carrier protein